MRASILHTRNAALRLGSDDTKSFIFTLSNNYRLLFCFTYQIVELKGVHIRVLYAFLNHATSLLHTMYRARISNILPDNSFGFDGRLCELKRMFFFFLLKDLLIEIFILIHFFKLCKNTKLTFEVRGIPRI